MGANVSNKSVDTESNILHWLDIENKFEKQNSVVCYRGVITDEITNSLCYMLHQIVLNRGSGSKVGRNIFAIAVEYLQNMMRYSRKRIDLEDIDKKNSENLGEGFIGVNYIEQDNEWEIMACNAIDLHEVVTLNEQLEKICNLSGEELSQAFQDKIEQGNVTDRGAGLGLLSIVKRSSKPIKYKIVEMPDKKRARIFISAYING